MFVEGMNAFGHLSPVMSLLVPFVSGFLTLACHLSRLYGWGDPKRLCVIPSCTQSAPGLGSLQGFTSPSAAARAASTRGQLVVSLAIPGTQCQASVPNLAAVP